MSKIPGAVISGGFLALTLTGPALAQPGKPPPAASNPKAECVMWCDTETHECRSLGCGAMMPDRLDANGQARPICNADGHTGYKVERRCYAVVRPH